jgi:cell wall-associated NlpC family hydrolase
MRSLRAAVAGAACLLVAAPCAAAQSNGNGGVSAPPAPSPAPAPAPVTAAKLRNGIAHPSRGTPVAVRRVLAAGNQIQRMPYRYGGGHASFKDTAYDCSGSVSFALHGAALVSSPLDSTEFEGWGLPGPGTWITVYANPQHAFVVVAGLRLDTSGTGGSGPRWQTVPRSLAGFTARHPAGL